MVERILVAIGNQPYEKNAFEYAGHLATLVDGSMSCRFFKEPDSDNSEQLANEVLTETKAICSEYALPCDIDVIYGDRVDNIVEAARIADLFVVGIPDSIKTEGLKLVYHYVDDILLNITKPTVVVHEQCTLLEKILVVHRGDEYSDRALELAAELGEKTNADILGLAIAETQPLAGKLSQQMQDYLRTHELKGEFMTALGFTVVNILETAEERDCDLIVLSASQHGKLYEMLFNTTTESVAKLADRAVLVAR